MTPYLCPPLRPCQPSDTDAVQHSPIPQHPLSQNVLLNPLNANFLANLHKFHDILIFVLFQGQGCHR